MSDLTVEDVKGLKVAELKQELSARGLAVSGLKKDLAGRLTAALEVGPAADDNVDETSAAGAEATADTPAASIETKEPQDGHEDVEMTVEEPTAVSQEGEVSQPSPQEEPGVGAVMVEGERSEEAAAAVPDEADVAAAKDTMPAALDAEVAEVVAVEEVKEAAPHIETPLRPLSPLPPRRKSPSPRQADADPSRPVTPEIITGKRSRSPSPGTTATINAPKRPRRREGPPLPSSLRHLIHPPTSVLYISNLRRPMQLSILHEYVFENNDDDLAATHLLPPPKNPFANSDFPGLWLSGVKDHAYASFRSVDSAIAAAERIEGVKWPEDTGDKLAVQFIDEDELDRLVEREQFAWSNGRQKMSLKITKDGEGGEFRFDLSVALAGGGGGHQGGLARGSFDRSAPLIDGRRPVYPRMPARGPPIALPLTGGVRGPMDRAGPPPRPGRGRPQGPPSYGRPPKYTRHRPSIMWREGPGAVR